MNEPQGEEGGYQRYGRRNYGQGQGYYRGGEQDGRGRPEAGPQVFIDDSQFPQAELNAEQKDA